MKCRNRLVSLMLAVLMIISFVPQLSYATGDAGGADLIQFEETEITLTSGESKALSVDFQADDTDDYLIWETSDPDVAEVEDGVVTAVSEGDCEIIVRTAMTDVVEEISVHVEDCNQPDEAAPDTDNASYLGNDNVSDEQPEDDTVAVPESDMTKADITAEEDFSENEDITNSVAEDITDNISEIENDNDEPSGSDIDDPEPEGTTIDIKKENYNVELSKEVYTFNNTERKPKVTVTAPDGTVLGSGSYTVSYSNNVSIGTAKVEVAGTGDYSGTLKAKFKIVPGKVSVKKVKTFSKGATVYLKPLSGGVSYQIQYKKSGGDWKSVKIGTATSKKLTKLTNRKNYYFRSRAFKKVNGKIYYGEWGTSKKAQIGIPISECKITGVKNKVYNGKKQSQSPKVTYKGENVKFSIKYSNHKDIGKHWIKITGKGKYVGTVTKYYKIKPGQVKMTGFCPCEWLSYYYYDWYDEPYYEYEDYDYGEYIERIDLQCSSVKGGVKYQFAFKYEGGSWDYCSYGKSRSVYWYDFPKNKKLYGKARAYKEVDGVKYYGKWSPVVTETSKWKDICNVKVSPESAYLKGYVPYAHKGEYLQIKVGKKTITKKITKSGKYKFNILIGKQKAGKKVTICLKTQFKENILNWDFTSYHSKIKKGYTKNDVKYTKGWGSPDKTASSSGGWSYWWYDNGSYIEFKNGRVYYWYKS